MLSCNLSDYICFMLQVKIIFGGGSFIVGINNCYNVIYIDGVVNNDVFGLLVFGINGG